MQDKKKGRSDVNDLGAATVETKGPFGPITDQRLGQVAAGLTNA